MTTEMTRDGGELGKRQGMSVAAANKTELIERCIVAFLDALLESPDGTASIEDADANLKAAFDDGGKWRGSLTRQLADRGIIESCGVVKSRRPSRHSGFVRLWRLKDREKAEQAKRQHQGELTTKKSDPSVAAAGSVHQKPTVVQRRLFDGH